MSQERHNYEYQIGPEGDNAPAMVVRMVGRDKLVMKIAAGPGLITKLLTSILICRVTALCTDSESDSLMNPAVGPY